VPYIKQDAPKEQLEEIKKLLNDAVNIRRKTTS
jgi:hypothetical protein